MEKLEFKLEIEAPKGKIWKVLWDDETYRQWASVFTEGTYAISDWNEGDKIHFLSSSGEGMSCIIEHKIINEYIAFRHVRDLKNFAEVSVDIATDQWNGAIEAYRLTQNNAITVLEISMDCIEKYVDYFKKTFPEAMAIIKKLSEK